MHKDSFQPLFIGKDQLILPSCHSTNEVAADLLSAGKATDGMVVITDRQTKGRGQRGNSWESEPFKNLTFSIIITPKFLPVYRQFELTKVASLALVDTLTEQGLKRVTIKWPNDVYCGPSKIAGILIENSVRTTSLESTIVGIGLNVNQRTFQVDNATSLVLETGKEHDRSALLTKLLKHFQNRYLRLQQGADKDLGQQYEHHLLWRGEKHLFENMITKTVITGTIMGTDQKGKLHIVTENQEFYFGFKEVVFLE